MKLKVYKSGGVKVGLNGKTFKYWRFEFGNLTIAGNPLRNQDIIYFINTNILGQKTLEVKIPVGERRKTYEYKKP